MKDANRAGGRTWSVGVEKVNRMPGDKKADMITFISDDDSFTFIVPAGYGEFIASACNAEEERIAALGAALPDIIRDARASHHQFANLTDVAEEGDLDGAANARATLAKLHDIGYLVEGADLSWGRHSNEPEIGS